MSVYEVVPRQRRSDSLGRYYTAVDISELLISQFENLNPDRVLDLGVGEGALSLAAANHWRSAELITVDVDSKASRSVGLALRKMAPGLQHRHIVADALDVRLGSRIDAEVKAIGAGICNPPFIVPQWRSGFSKIVEDAGFSGVLPAISTLDTAVLFLSQNLRLLELGAKLGIIVPDSLISAARYREFRRTLVSKFNVVRVIRLPRSSFIGTDALAHILVVDNRKTLDKAIQLHQVDAHHRLSRAVEISCDDAIERLDYAYHAELQSLQRRPQAWIALSQVWSEVRRGRFS